MTNTLALHDGYGTRARSHARLLLETQQQLTSLLRDLYLDGNRAYDGPTDSPPAARQRYLTRITVRDEGRAYFVRTVDVDWFEGSAIT